MFSIIPAQAASEDNQSVGATSGTTGDCIWTYDPSSKVLTISGNGRMADYDSWYYDFDSDSIVGDNMPPWFDIGYTKVNILYGVQNIGKNAFNEEAQASYYGDWENRLGSVTIANSVTEIGEYAFENCHNLKQITLPNSISVIRYYTFAWSGLTSIEIPATVKRIEPYAFRECTNLESVRFNYGLEELTGGVFENCNLKNIVLPDSLLSISEHDFYGNNELTTLLVPESVSSIYNAFGRCNKLTINGYSGSYVQEYAERNLIPFKVVSKNISLCEITATPSVVIFDGTTKYPDITVKNRATQVILTQGNDYSVSYPNAIYPGNYTVTIVGKGKYSGSTLCTFSIIEASKTDISTCSIILSPTSFTYDGTAKTPSVTIKDGEIALTNGTDYSVSYPNAINVGTYTVTITGTGNYAGSTTRIFSITEAPKTAISNCSVTLNPTSFTYDGSAKAPTVTVKDGTKTLTNGTDYSVNCPNAVNAGTYTVTITGMGNYIGSTTRTFTITSPKQQFVWGSDNYNFLNSAPTYFPYSKYRDQINNVYASKLKKNLTNSEYQVIFEGTWYSDAWLDENWGGSCYGMSSTTLLAKEGLLPYSSYQSGATKLHDFGYPKNNSNLLSLITYYQMLQVKDIIQQQYRTVPNKTNKENITNLISLLDKNTTVLVGFQKAGWGGHAILATGYEYGSWTWNGISYQGCIKICDPNAATAYNTRYNIYFNTSSYNWTIPGYSNMTSTAGAKFNYIGANVNEINKGGYLSGTSNQNSEDFVARIDAHKISDNRSVSKVVNSNGYYMNQSSLPGEIVEDYSYILGNESEGTIGYNLYDSNASYKVSQSNAETLQLTMDYENCLLSGGSLAGTSVIFDKNGYVEVNGESAVYNLSATFDSDYPTDWFTIQASGYNANTASLRMVDNGYVLTADNLEKVTVKANNREFTAQTKFSTDYTSVFIYEIDEETIGLKVDTDNNGTYETELAASDDTAIIGDANGDNSIDVLDATVVQKYSVGRADLTEEQIDLADVNNDGVVDILDAAEIQKFAAGKITEFKKKA